MRIFPREYRLTKRKALLILGFDLILMALVLIYLGVRS